MAQGFYSARSLWIHGHNIGGKRAWRIIIPGKNRSGAKRRVPLTGKLVCFGPDDIVYVRTKAGLQRKGHYDYTTEKYKRQWYLSFLVTLWFLHNFNVDNMVRTLVDSLGVRASKKWMSQLFLKRLKFHWGEIKQYMASKFGVDIQELVKNQMEITRIGMEKGNQNPAYLSIANTSNMNLLRVVAEIEDKPATDKTLKSTGQQILDELRKQRDDSADGQRHADSPTDDPRGKAGVSEGAVEAV